ncbi:MAG: hypothetical protein ACRYGK_16990 [Janthinobacterium lividum]
MNRSAPVAPTSMPAPVFDDYPEYHAQAVGCGLEDRDITGRYQAMQHGWDQASELIAERIDGFLGALHDDHVAALEAAKAEGARMMQEAAAADILCVIDHKRDTSFAKVYNEALEYALFLVRAIDHEEVLRGTEQ